MEIKKIGSLDVKDDLTGGEYLLIEENGYAKRVPAGAIGTGGNPAIKTVERTAAGAEVLLELRPGMTARSVSSHIEAAQPGEGVPYAAGKGKNLLPPLAQETTLQGVTFTPLEDGGLHVHGVCTASAGSGSFFHIPAAVELPAGSYCLSAGNDAAHGAMKLRLLDADGNIIGMADMNLNVEKAWMLLEYGSARSVAQYTIRLQGGETYDVTLHPQLEAGEAATAFAPYENIRPIGGFDSVTLTHNGTAYTQALGETVYGGVFDWTSGRLTVTHGVIASYAAEALPGAWISDRDAYADGAVPTTGAQVVYALSTPRSVQLDAQAIEMVIGENALTSDTGRTEVAYSIDMPGVIDDEGAREDRTWSAKKTDDRIKPIEQELSGETRIRSSCAVIECEEGEEISVHGAGEVTLHHCGRNLISGIGGVGSSYTVNGVTYLIRPDGMIEMTGTPTAGSSSGSFLRIMKAYLPAGRYIFSATKALSPSSRYPILSYLIGDNEKSVTLDAKTEAIFYLTQGATVEIGLYNKADGYTIDGESIALQLERSDTQTHASPYEPYRGTVSTARLPAQLTAYGGANAIFAENADIDVSVKNTIRRRIETAMEEKKPQTAYGLPVLNLKGDASAMSKENAVGLEYTFRECKGSCTLKWQGSSSLAHPKKNYTIKFDEAFEAIDPDYRYADTLDRKWGVQKKYVLKANYIDATHARNVVSARLWAEMVKSRANADEKLLASPNCGAVDGFPVLVRLNGEFLGLYTMNIPKDGWMMGMGQGSEEAIFGAEVTGSAGTTFTGTGSLDTDFEIEYAPDENNTAWATDSLARMINACVSSDGSDLDTTVAQYLDLESAIDYYIFAVMLRGTDILSRNYLLATYDGVKWFFTPYDLDSTFGLTWTGRDFKTAGNSLTTFKGYAGVTHADQVHRAMQLIWTYKKDALIARYKELRETVLSEAHVQDAFLNFAARIPYGAYDMDRRIWPDIPASAASSVAQIFAQYRVSCDLADKELGV